MKPIPIERGLQGAQRPRQLPRGELHDMCFTRVLSSTCSGAMLSQMKAAEAALWSCGYMA